MKKVLSTVAAVIAAAAIAPAAAGADTSAQVLGVSAYNGGNSATVKVRYSCDTPGLHLWVSGKQIQDPDTGFGIEDSRLEQEGSSGVADGWLQRHPTNLDCDGAQHVGFFKINKSEYGFGVLNAGPAWLQFCLTEGDNLLAYDYRWINVRVLNQV